MTTFPHNPEVQAFWQSYLASLDPALRPVNARVEASFAGNQEITDGLIELYLCGKKTAGSSLVRDFETCGEELPRVGNHWIALDSQSRPRCILKTTRVVINRFGDLPAEIAQAEGEDDLSVDSWKRVHADLYRPHLARWGITNLDDALVITEYFEVVYERSN